MRYWFVEMLIDDERVAGDFVLDDTEIALYRRENGHESRIREATQEDFETTDYIGLGNLIAAGLFPSETWDEVEAIAARNEGRLHYPRRAWLASLSV